MIVAQLVRPHNSYAGFLIRPPCRLHVSCIWSSLMK